MLTRFRVRNFKNFEEVDVFLGPFTCVAGPNGAGKSNLFDAIAFLGALGNMPLLDAARHIRGVDGQNDVRNLFRRTGTHQEERMSFLAEMIIPPTGVDELGQAAEASITFLCYELELGWRQLAHGLGTRLEIIREELKRISRDNAKQHLPFTHSDSWRDSAVQGKKKASFISTEDGKETIIALHSDSKPGGHIRRVFAQNLPRTVLSGASNAAEHRTLTLVRQEMLAWTQLQLEPSALRRADNFGAPTQITANGEHLPATLYALALSAEAQKEGGAENLYAGLANHLSQLVESVHSIYVDRDEKRQTLSIVMTDQEDTEHLASSLSDGTLRFLALSVLKYAPHGQRLLCLEEPENGIHPQRIQPMLQLLRDLAVDVHDEVNNTNPMRQVIINTHSPLVVASLAENELLFVQNVKKISHGTMRQVTQIACIAGGWRKEMPEISRGEMIRYLSPPTDQTILSSSAPLIRNRPEIRQLGLFDAPMELK